MIINDLDGCYIVFDTKNRNMELDTLYNNVSALYFLKSPNRPFGQKATRAKILQCNILTLVLSG